jgi:hypothetical protein
MVSNLGVLPFETNVGRFKLESLWGPSVFVGIEGEQMIGVATLNGAVHLLHTSYTPIPKLLQTMAATLEAMARPRRSEPEARARGASVGALE